MKLRIKGDTLRLRLTQPEVALFAAEGCVEDALHVAPGAALRYRLYADPEATALGAVWNGSLLTVVVPEGWARPWAEGNEVGVEGAQAAGEGHTLTLLVEKDFACLHEARDEPGAFPNPFSDVPGYVDADD